MARSLILAGLAGLLWLVALVALPTTAFGQTTTTPTATATHTSVPSTATPTATQTQTQTQTQTPTPTPTPGPGLTLSSGQGAPGSNLTASASGFQPGETVNIDFNGNGVGSGTVDTTGKLSVTFPVPNLAPGTYNVNAVGQTSGISQQAQFNINSSGAGISLSSNQAAPGASITVTASGFQPGETVDVRFNGVVIANGTVNTTGTVDNLTFTVPNLGPGQYQVEVHGQTSGVDASATFTVLSAATPTATPVPGTPTATPPGPTNTPLPAPTIRHDDRYFSQTGYRIDDDQVWSFFQSYGGIQTFGFPASRTFTFLGCPVQFFQRQIIQVCPSQGPALINMLDPDIFPYTHVNGSTFPAPDDTIKNNTPPVNSPTYSSDIIPFIQKTVPDQYGGQQVNFFQYFNNQGGLTIWGAPISNPQPDPNNGNFIYQRFQRGIMHYIQGTGTESILLADYLKALMLNQNVPPDLLQEAQGSRFLNQYCPGAPLWLCRPNDLSGTDLTFAFVPG
jgi:hypothetical protein